MNSLFWAKIHGGSTHFPIALVLASVLFDLTGFVLNRQPTSRDLHMAAFYALLLGAVASFVAVLSGLVVSSWETFGKGNLYKHHIFLWPAFALVVGMAVWRLVVREQASRKAYTVYLATAAISALLLSVAGYYGGELLLSGAG